MLNFNIDQWNCSIGNLNNTTAKPAPERESNECNELSPIKYDIKWFEKPLHKDLYPLLRELSTTMTDDTNNAYLVTSMPTTNKEEHQLWLEHKQLMAVKRKFGKVSFMCIFREMGDQSGKFHTHSIVVSPKDIYKDYHRQTLSTKVYFDVRSIDNTDKDLLLALMYVSKGYESTHIRHQNYDHSRLSSFSI